MPIGKTEVDKLHDTTTILYAGAACTGTVTAILGYHAWKAIEVARKTGTQPHISGTTGHWLFYMFGATIVLLWLAGMTARRMSYVADTLATMSVMRNFVSGSQRRRRRMAVRHNKTRKGG